MGKCSTYCKDASSLPAKLYCWDDFLPLKLPEVAPSLQILYLAHITLQVVVSPETKEQLVFKELLCFCFCVGSAFSGWKLKVAGPQWQLWVAMIQWLLKKKLNHNQVFFFALLRSSEYHSEFSPINFGYYSTVQHQLPELLEDWWLFLTQRMNQVNVLTLRAHSHAPIAFATFDPTI